MASTPKTTDADSQLTGAKPEHTAIAESAAELGAAVRRRRGSFERRLHILWALAALPAAGLFLWLMLALQLSALAWASLALLLLLFYLALGIYAFGSLTRPLYSLLNLIEAIRLEDYSLRARAPYRSGLLPELYQELAALAGELQQRKGRYDQHLFLLYCLVEELPNPVIVLDRSERLLLANRAAENWLGHPLASLKGRPAASLGLIQHAESWRLEPAAAGKSWRIRHSSFRDGEQQYQLLLLDDIESELQHTELQAWQNIVRVLNHEVRNSLTPISALTQDLLEAPELQQSRHLEALALIQSRSHSLLRFIDSYSNLSKLPAPNRQWFQIEDLFSTLKPLAQPARFEVEAGLRVFADRAQLEQVLINLIKNAREASAASQRLLIQAQPESRQVLVKIIDQGHGISNPANLFVPFYTTKAGGSGIGLVLSRQIVRNHGGELKLANRSEARGAIATVSLPS